MKKEIIFQYSGKLEKLGFTSIIRSLPNRFVDAVGHFVFLDQIPFKAHKTDWLKKELSLIEQGSFAHPHKGIVTVTYIIKGTVEHFDSAGNHGIVHDGGMQWMNSGNGIIHDEAIHANDNNSVTEFFGAQFWINLSSKNKANKPEYMAIDAIDIPLIVLPDNTGNLKVLIGNEGEIKSKIPTYSKLFLYHLDLNVGKSHIVKIDKTDEVAITLLNGMALINNSNIKANDFIVFDTDGDTIEIVNTSKASIDIMIFGGEPYTEPIAFGGPYVMNNQKEIAIANTEFYARKYGTINYNKKD